MTPFGVEFVMCVKVLAYCAVKKAEFQSLQLRH